MLFQFKKPAFSDYIRKYVLYKKNNLDKKKLGRDSLQYKHIQIKYTKTCKNKKKCFELAMSS